MKTEFKKLPKNLAELTIELSVEEIQPYLEKAAKKISQSLEIPGFRKGKVPYEVVKQRVGEGEILKEAIEFNREDAIAEAKMNYREELICV